MKNNNILKRLSLPLTYCATIFGFLILPKIAIAFSIPSIINPKSQAYRTGNYSIADIGYAAIEQANLILFLIGATALLFFIIGGIMLIMGGANQKILEKGKAILKGSIIGMVFVFGSFMIVDFTLEALGYNAAKFGKWYEMPAGPAPSLGSGSRGPASVAAPTTPTAATPRIPTNVAPITLLPRHNRYDNLLNQYASQYGVDPLLTKAIMIAESSANPNAQSGVGAVGLMQIMPKNGAAWLSVTEAQATQMLQDPETNIRLGTRYINTLIQNPCRGAATCSNTDLRYAIAAYNGGPGANASSKDCPGMAKWECNIKPGGYVETQNYVKRVLNIYNALQQQR